MVDYIFQLTPEEQRRVVAAMGRSPSASASPPSGGKTTDRAGRNGGR